MAKFRADSFLKKNGLKATHQRILLLKEIIKHGNVFSAISLHKKLKSRIDLATIYRILNVFLKNKIIREVISNDITRFYELSCEQQLIHPHFICKKCNKIICLNAIDNKYISDLKKNANKNEIDDIVIQLAGLCFKCK